MPLLRHYIRILPVALFVATPHVHGMDSINAVDNHINSNQDVNKQLIEAAMAGNVTRAQECINNGANVNARDFLGETPLHKAAIQGHTEVTKLLIHNGANVNWQDDLEITPLHMAALEAYTDVAKLLIHNDANVNAQRNVGITPLHWAAFWRDTDAVKLLIHNGANVNSQDCSGSTPLTLARSIGRTDITALFDRIHNLLNGNIDAVITDDMPRDEKLYYTKAMIAYGYCDTAHHIISDKLKTLSDEEYAGIMSHAVLHRNNIDHDTYNQFITDIRNTYEDDNKRQAVANTAWSCARYGYTAPHVTEWVLNNYENECRNFCDEHGNTIAHLSADTRLNYLQPRIMTLVMQNTNHKPRNADGKTPVMLHHEIGNHEGVDIIKAKIGLEQASRGYTKQYDIKLYHTRLISRLYQLGCIDKPQTPIGFDIDQSRNTTPIPGLPRQRKSIADLDENCRNHIFEFIGNNDT